MILTDRQVKALGDKVIVSGYDPANVKPVSYDIAVGYIINEGEQYKPYMLEPHSYIFIGTKEEIHVPDDLMLRVGNKNSLIRRGLNITAPAYFPGHQTRMFLRVENLSPYPVRLYPGMPIAQLFYERLESVPETTYDRQEGASYNNETEFREYTADVSVDQQRTENDR